MPQTKGLGFPALIKQLPQHRPWMITISVISVVVVLATCGFGTLLLLRDEAQPVGAPTGGPSVQRRDVSTRELDPVPLTIEDVFPEPQFVVPDWPPYAMIGPPQAGENCGVAGSEEVERALARSSCTQFIRASFAAPDNVYFVTGGLLNLQDSEKADELREEIEELIRTGQGRLSGYVSDSAVNQILYSATARITMRVYGHFLLYAVVVRRDGAVMGADEQGERVVSDDMVRQYLRDTVIVQRWSTMPAVTDPATAASESTEPAASATT